MQLEPEQDKQHDFRFSGGGYPCPYCNSRTGWSFIRNYGKEYGVCFACGIRNYPCTREVKLGRNNEADDTHRAPSRFVPLQVVDKTLAAYHSNPFVQFLEETFGTEITGRIVSHFRIGTARNGGTVFWYFDKEGYCRKPKVVFYASDGHRIKDDPDRQPHCGGYTKAKGYTLPLFGEQQLNERLYPASTPVVLVESEKTACIGYAFLPQLVWMASGGSRSMNKTRAAVLENRQVLVLPDADDAGREGAQQTLSLLKSVSVKGKIKDLFPAKSDHSDLADHLINSLLRGCAVAVNASPIKKQLPLAHPMPTEQISKIELLFNKHPVLWELNLQLGLEITGLKP